MNRKDYIAFASIKYIRISPFKLRKVADQVRGMDIISALNLLQVMHQKGAVVLYKALHSAYSNARQKDSVDADSLKIAGIIVDEAPRLKRVQPRARGRAFSIIKRSSHIKIGLNTKTGVNNGSKS